ncbi:MAG: hypothetical protein QOE53_906 [Pseudonocardiales bacterium]|jgi:hypothetical protein|nr:hypothetical protein [Pseudonocardiales bacterium]
MTNPLDNEVYGDKRVEDDNAALNGNPGKPQSDYQLDDAEPDIDPSDFEGTSGTGTVVPGTVVPTDPEDEPN